MSHVVSRTLTKSGVKALQDAGVKGDIRPGPLPIPIGEIGTHTFVEEYDQWVPVIVGDRLPEVGEGWRTVVSSVLQVLAPPNQEPMCFLCRTVRNDPIHLR